MHTFDVRVFVYFPALGEGYPNYFGPCGDRKKPPAIEPSGFVRMPSTTDLFRFGVMDAENGYI